MLTREQLQELEKDSLIEYALKLSDLNSLFSKLENRIKEVESYNEVSSNVNSLLTIKIESMEKKIIEMEKKTTRNSQYARNRQLELHRVPTTITDPDLKEKVCSTLSLTGVAVKSAEIDKCHRLKRKDSVIIEFKFRDKRDPILASRKHLKNKKKELKDLGMENVIVTESLCQEYQEIDFICRRLKKDNKIAETWFFNGRLFIKHDSEGTNRVQITHISDLVNEFDYGIIDSIMGR